METRELERIHFTTRHFNDLQGLRYGVPLGLITLGLGGPALLRAGFFLGALLLTLGARRYYRSTFGAVERQQVDLDADLYPFSVFSPAGPIPRLEGIQQVPPMMRRFLVTLALAVALFSIVQAMPSSFRVEGERALGQHPRISSLPSGFRERPWIIGRQPQPTGIFQPPWVAWIYSLAPARPPSMLRAVFAQAAYLPFGSFFLSVWLWRERRGSQSYQLALAVLLLGLAACSAPTWVSSLEPMGCSRRSSTACFRLWSIPMWRCSSAARRWSWRDFSIIGRFPGRWPLRRRLREKEELATAAPRVAADLEPCHSEGWMEGRSHQGARSGGGSVPVEWKVKPKGVVHGLSVLAFPSLVTTCSLRVLCVRSMDRTGGQGGRCERRSRPLCGPAPLPGLSGR